MKKPLVTLAIIFNLIFLIKTNVTHAQTPNYNCIDGNPGECLGYTGSCSPSNPVQFGTCDDGFLHCCPDFCDNDTVRASESCPLTSQFPFCEVRQLSNCPFLAGVRCWMGDSLVSQTGSCTLVTDPTAPVPTSPPSVETGFSCNNRNPGHCPIDPYEFCVENIAVQDCPSGGGLLCFINYYSPIGTNEPFNQGACASRTEDALCSPIGSPACCPVCPVDYAWSYTNLTCIQVTATDTNYADPNFVDCSSSTLACYPGHGCIPASTAIATPPMKCDPAGQPAGTGIDTAIGCIPFADNNAFVKFVLGWSIGIGGGISFLLSAASGFIMATSAGDPKKLAAGKELLMAALSGLLLLIFSVFVLRLFGFEILQIPGF